MQHLLPNDILLLEKAKTDLKINRDQLRKWNKQKPKDLDQRFHAAHQKEFAKRDCLKCANCCKTTSPIFRQPDIRRMAKALRTTITYCKALLALIYSQTTPVRFMKTAHSPAENTHTPTVKICIKSWI
ncbi:MAG: hypothetical protein RLZZ211_1292 [Bacteroidota bacterium]